MLIATGLFLAVFLLTSLLVGVRLLVLYGRTRRPPELLIGISILGVGPGGMGGLLGASVLARTESFAAPYAAATAVLLIVTGLAAAALFNWRVYRPDSPRTRGAVLAIVTLAGIGFGIELGVTAFADPLHPGPGVRVVTLCSSGTFLWGSFESLRYWLLMRRRLALGLADPLVTNRFLLYGLGIGAAGLGSVVSMVARAVLGLGMQQMPALMLSNSAFGLLSAVLMWVAFVPPRFYRRRIAGAAS